MSADKVVPIGSRQRVSVAHVTLPPLPDIPAGPFTLTIADADGKMVEVEFPDHTGNLPANTAVLGMAGSGIPELLVNLLTGALRIYVGRPE